MRGVVERYTTGHRVEGRFQVGLGRRGVDGVREIDKATVGRRVGRLGQTPVMQGLVGVDEHALLRKRGEIDRTTLDGVPAIVTARAAQGPDFQICIGGRAAFDHIGRRSRVGRHVRDTVGRRESHQIRLEVLVGERDHIHGGRQRQIGTVQQTRTHVALRTSRHEIHGRRLNRYPITSRGRRERRSGRRVIVLMRMMRRRRRVLEVRRQLLELPVNHQRVSSSSSGSSNGVVVGVVTAGLQR